MAVRDPTKVQIAVPNNNMDQIIGVRTGSFTVPAGSVASSQSGFDSFDTGFNDSCLFVALFSIDGGVSWYTNGSSYPNGTDAVVGQLTLNFSASSDVDGTVAVSASFNQVAIAYTVLYKIALIAKSDQGRINPLPLTQTLSYRSNLNYMKIVLDGKVLLTPSQTLTIPHGQSGTPNFLTWVGSDEFVTSDNRVLFAGGPNSGGLIDATNLTLLNTSATRSRLVHYRVYADA